MTDTLELLAPSSSGPAIRHGEPVTIGVPIPISQLFDAQKLQLLTARGNPVSCQTRILDCWPDGSARWVLLTFFAHQSLPKESYSIKIVSTEEYEVCADSNRPALQVIKDASGLCISTGKITANFHCGKRWPIREITGVDSKLWLDASSGLHITAENGAPLECKTEEICIESSGEIHAVVKCRGAAQISGGRRLDIDWSFEFFAGMPVILVDLTIRNPHRAIHPGGFWELGDPGSILLRNTTFKCVVSESCPTGYVSCSLEPNLAFEQVKIPFEIYQDSSGGENWCSTNHINREGHIPMSFRGYRRSDAPNLEFSRATPVVSLKTSCGPLTLAPRYFWQNFPKAIQVSQHEISYGLFPVQWNDLHEIQGGEQKTHTFALSFGADGVTENALEWFRQPLVPKLNPAWVVESRAISYFTDSSSDSGSKYQELVSLSLDNNEGFEHKSEVIDEYGWRHFGDLYGDHETIYASDFSGPGPLISHYNNQYDAIAGFCYQWLRTGDTRWWSLLNQLAAHVVDIDIYHTNEDKSAYNHGLFWHTVHYIDAGRSTHRSYPRTQKSQGGGPANEHVYTSGLLLHYFLTGNQASRDAALELANFIIAIDDGQQTIFRWLAKGNTGLASASRSPEYHGPGRGSANAVNALIDGHRMTGEMRFLEKAEQLIRRVCHPQQDIAKLSLLDTENRWFYTMFLQSLGKYLDYKIELRQLDSMYAYGRAALLHYAGWMASNEYPYLEKPEVLEYPTETWAAQDLRKSEVFRYAWLHASEDKRGLFEERAQFFFKYAISALAEMKTRSLCRPLVLLLSYGWTHSWFDSHSTFRTPEPKGMAPDWPDHQRFIPQKERALFRAKLLVLIGALVSLIGLIAMLAAFR